MSKKIPNKKVPGKRMSNTSLSEKPKPKKQKMSLSNHDEDGITKTKQLTMRLSSKTRNRNNNAKGKNLRICPNGTPMPSLAELKKMFEDSEEEDIQTPTNASPMPSLAELEKNFEDSDDEDIKTNAPPVTKNKDIISPGAKQEIVSRILDTLSNITDPGKLLDVLPPAPIVPQKKPKKSGIPYVIGCTERPQVIRKPKTNWAQGDDKYGVYDNAAGPEDSLEKQQSLSNSVNVSKSIFNPQSDQIAKMLTANDYLSDSSTDSSKTIPYYEDQCNNNLSSSNRKSFSPLPSTSKDNDTFQKNDKLFIESFENDYCDDSDLEIIDTPYETICIDENIEETNTKCIQENYYDGAVQFVGEEKPKQHDTSIQDVIDIEDYYSSILLQESYDVDDIDVDDVIAESNAIINKYRHTSKLNTMITDVAPSQSDTLNKNINTIDNTAETKNLLPCQSNTAKQINTSKSTTIISDEEPSQSHTSRNQTNASDSTPAIQVDAGRDNQNNNRHNSLISSARNNTSNTSNTAQVLNLEKVVTDFFNSWQQSNSDMGNSETQSQNSSTNNQSHHAYAYDGGEPKRVNDVTPSTSKDKGCIILDDCPICLEKLGSRSVAATMCGHIFCLICIKTSLKSGKKCPTCRKKLRANDFHQLFI